MKTRTPRKQSEVFKAWLYYNAQQARITFREFRAHVWPEWISVFRYPVHRA